MENEHVICQPFKSKIDDDLTIWRYNTRSFDALDVAVGFAVTVAAVAYTWQFSGNFGLQYFVKYFSFWILNLKNIWFERINCRFYYNAHTSHSPAVIYIS